MITYGEDCKAWHTKSSQVLGQGTAFVFVREESGHVSIHFDVPSAGIIIKSEDGYKLVEQLNQVRHTILQCLEAREKAVELLAKTEEIA